MRRTLLGRASATISATLVATVVVPTPPLGLNTATRRCRAVVPDGAAGPGSAAGGLRPQREGLEAGDELGLVERPRDHLVRAGLDEVDRLVEMAALGDGEDRQPGSLLARRSIVTTSPTVAGAVTESIIIRL